MRTSTGGLTGILVALAASFGLAGLGTAQNVKDKSGDAKVDPVELEKQLMTVPEKAADREAWWKTWRKHLTLGFRAPVGRNVIRTMQAFTIDNRTPCTLRVKLREELFKDGKKTKAAPPEDGWEVLPGKKLYLGVQPKIPIITVKHDLKPGTVVSAINEGKYADLYVKANHAELKDLHLAVMIRYAEQGNVIGPSIWMLVKPDEVEGFFKR